MWYPPVDCTHQSHLYRHYKRASGALLVYDVSSRSSFENAERVWLRELRNAADSTSSLLDCLVLVGNKVGRSIKYRTSLRIAGIVLLMLAWLRVYSVTDALDTARWGRGAFPAVSIRHV